MKWCWKKERFEELIRRAHQLQKEADETKEKLARRKASLLKKNTNKNWKNYCQKKKKKPMR